MYVENSLCIMYYNTICSTIISDLQMTVTVTSCITLAHRWVYNPPTTLDECEELSQVLAKSIPLYSSYDHHGNTMWRWIHWCVVTRWATDAGGWNRELFIKFLCQYLLPLMHTNPPSCRGWKQEVDDVWWTIISSSGSFHLWLIYEGLSPTYAHFLNIDMVVSRVEHLKSCTLSPKHHIQNAEQFIQLYSEHWNNQQTGHPLFSMTFS